MINKLRTFTDQVDAFNVIVSSLDAAADKLVAERQALRAAGKALGLTYSVVEAMLATIDCRVVMPGDGAVISSDPSDAAQHEAAPGVEGDFLGGEECAFGGGEIAAKEPEELVKVPPDYQHSGEPTPAAPAFDPLDVPECLRRRPLEAPMKETANG